MPALILKIVEKSDWGAASKAGFYLGSQDDLRDGFIHLSTPAQLDVTAEKHFSNRKNLLLVAFDARSLGERLKWEPSRGGDLFPHYYGKLDTTLALWAMPMSLDDRGIPRCVFEVVKCDPTSTD